MLSSVNDPYAPRSPCIVWEIEQTYQAEVMPSANCATVDVEPQTMRQAMMSPNSAQRKCAAKDEYNSLMDHGHLGADNSTTR